MKVMKLLGHIIGLVCLAILFSAPGLKAYGECGDGTLCADGFCCSIHGYCGTDSNYCSPENCKSQCPVPSPPPPPAPPSPPPPPPAPPCDNDVSNIITKEIFEEMFPNRAAPPNCEGAFYTYDAFIAAARTYCEFGTTGTDEIRRRELAAFFGQTSQETTGGGSGWSPPGGPYVWGYCFVNERYRGDYCSWSQEWPCVPGQQYYGRGPMQLTHNYNYGPAGKALGLDLLSNPSLVAEDPVLSFKAAMWFWMTPQYKKPSCHDVMIGKWIPTPEDVAANRQPGYGVVTNIINGGIECGRGFNEKVQGRIGFYKRYCGMLETTTGDHLDCGDQRSFGVTLKDTYPKSFLKMPTDLA